MKKLVFLLLAVAVVMAAQPALAQYPRGTYNAIGGTVAAPSTGGVTRTYNLLIRKDFAPDRRPVLLTLFTNTNSNGVMKVWFPGGDGWGTPADGGGASAVTDTLIMPNTPMFIVPRSNTISIKNTGAATTYIYLNAEY